MSVQKCVVEFIGVFFLVFTIGMSVIGRGDDIVIAPLVISAALMVMVYAGGHISGAHYNPAVTLGVLLRGKCTPVDAASYIVAQVVGAALGAAIVLFMKGSVKAEAMTIDVEKALIAEFLFTFALTWVVLNVATSKSTAGNSYYGLAIAFTVLAGAYAVGGISGGAFNPGVAVGLVVMGLVKVSDVWVHLVGDFGGAAVAALAFKGIVPASVRD